MSLEIYYGVPGLIGAAVILSFLTIVAVRTPPSRAKGAFGVLSIAAFVYCLGDGLARLSASEMATNAATNWLTVRFFGVAFLPTGLLLFASAYPREVDLKWVRFARVVALAISLAFSALRATTTLVVQSTLVENRTASTVVGPAFPTFIAFGFACYALTAWLLWRAMRNAASELEWAQALRGLVASLLPVAATVALLALFRESYSPVFDPVVPALAVTVFVYAEGLLSQGLAVAPTAAVREVLLGLPDGLCIVNRRGTVVFANPACADLVGLKDHPLEGLSVEEVFRSARVPDNARAQFIEAYGAITRAGRDVASFSYEFNAPRPLAVLAHVTSIDVGHAGAGGASLGPLAVSDRYVFFVFRDVTESRQKELVLSRSIEVRDLFISMLGHDIKAPLNAIMGYGELISLDAQSTPEALSVYRYAQQVIDSSRQIEFLIENSRTLSRLLDPSALMRAVEPVNVQTIAEKEIANLRSVSERRHIKVEIEKLPADVSPTIVAAPILRSVFQNLIHNAIKYAPENSTVRVLLRGDADTVEVDVQDEGPGVPVDKREVIFKRFSRLAQTAATTEGLGLGLAITKQIVELHKGTIAVLDRPDGKQGALFRVRLPREAVSRSPS